MDAVALDGLDEARLAGLRIDGEYRNVVLAAVENLLAFEVELALVAVGEIDEAAVRMHVDRARALRRFDIGGVGQGVLDEDRVAAEGAVRLQLIGIELVLPLDRDIDPRLGGVEIEMPRPEAEPSPGRNRCEVRQRAALEFEELERAGILGFAAGGVVAARDQDRSLVSRCRADLMPVDAGIKLARLAHRLADGAVAVDAMHGDVARVVVGGEQIFAGSVDAGMDRARRQGLRLAMRREGARDRIDAEGIGQMRGAGDARSAAARHDVEIAFRRMRPGILDVGRQHHPAAFLERGIGDVDVEQGELRPGTGIKDGLGCHLLTPRAFRGCDRAGKERGEGAAVDHGLPPVRLLLQSMVARMECKRNPGLSGSLTPLEPGPINAAQGSCPTPNFRKLKCRINAVEDSMRLKNKIAIVVGAGQSPGEGIGNGRATVLRFAQEGARIFAVDRDLASAEETAAIVRKDGGDCVAYAADVTREATLAAAMAAAVERWGRIDILHNNVGVSIAGGDKPLLELTEEAFDRVSAINLRGTIMACKHALPIMRRQRSGAIVNISSVAAFENTYPLVTYKVTKAGMVAFTQQLALQNAPYGIRANCILPGLMDTPMAVDTRARASNRSRAEVAAERDAKVPLRGKMGTGWDVANAALFLASDEANFITGVALPVDGGALIKIG